MDPEVKASLKKLVWGTVIFLGAFIAIALPFREELEVLGTTIAGGLGLPGIGLGIMLSDMLTLPIPPDVYLALAVTGGLDTIGTIIWGSIGSMLGGIGAFVLGRLLGKTRFAQRLVAPFREQGMRFINRLGVTAVIVAALTPIPFSIISTLAGMMGMRFLLFLPATLFRIPRIAGYLLLIKWGWIVVTGA